MTSKYPKQPTTQPRPVKQGASNVPLATCTLKQTSKTLLGECRSAEIRSQDSINKLRFGSFVMASLYQFGAAGANFGFQASCDAWSICWCPFGASGSKLQLLALSCDFWSSWSQIRTNFATLRAISELLCSLWSQLRTILSAHPTIGTLSQVYALNHEATQPDPKPSSRNTSAVSGQLKPSSKSWSRPLRSQNFWVFECLGSKVHDFGFWLSNTNIVSCRFSVDEILLLYRLHTLEPLRALPVNINALASRGPLSNW